MKYRVIFSYTIIGVLFGSLFPLVAGAWLILQSSYQATLGSFLQIQRENPLMWMIDTAPLFLGLFAMVAGVRQARIYQLNNQLNGQFREQEQLSSQLTELKHKLELDVEKQLIQLKASSHVARTASAIHDLDQLLEDTVRLISQEFGYYHASIFLVDERNEFAVLSAASSEGGKRMLARNHKLAIGKVGIVGHVAQSGKPRIALDVGEDAIFFDNPDLPLTRSEMALPLNLREQTIGVLDVQSTDSGAFREGDISILQTLADQLALAINNARLYSETQLAIRELDALNNRLVTQAWSPWRRQNSFSYQYDRLDVKPVLDSTPVIEAPDQSHLMTLPILFRGQQIGTIALARDNEKPPWEPSEIDVFGAVVSQIGLVLENIRTLTDLQHRTEREHLIADISTRLWASSDIPTILRTAAHEIGSAFEVAEATIQLESPVPTNGRNHVSHSVD